MPGIGAGAVETVPTIAAIVAAPSSRSANPPAPAVTPAKRREPPACGAGALAERDVTGPWSHSDHRDPCSPASVFDLL